MLGKSLSSTPHFYDKITASLKNNEEVEMIDGMYRSVLSYSQAAELIYALSLLKTKPQIINVCSDESLSKYDMGCILAESLGASKALIKKISEDEGKKFFKDKRASFGAMDNALLKSLLNKEKIMWEVEIC
jgi:dTDP-4-dehydrorhamnose reductase